MQGEKAEVLGVQLECSLEFPAQLPEYYRALQLLQVEKVYEF